MTTAIKKCSIRLKGNSVYVSIEKSTGQKLLYHLQRGNFNYITNRAWLEVRSHFHPFSKTFGLSTVVILIIIVVVFLNLFVLNHIFPIRWWMAKGVAVLFLAAMVFVPRMMGVGNFIMMPTDPPTISASKATSFFTCRTGSGGPGVEIQRIFNKDGDPIGQAINLKRPCLKAKYFAHNDVYNKYLRYKRGKNIVLATSGGFTNHAFQPEGLTVENGDIVNAVMMPDRHGLVCVEKTGAIRVLNLKRNRFHLPHTNKQIQSPLSSLKSYSELIKWCRKTDATLFQTQLLAYSDTLLIDPTKAKPEERERRILALYSDPHYEGSVSHDL